MIKHAPILLNVSCNNCYRHQHPEHSFAKYPLQEPYVLGIHLLLHGGIYWKKDHRTQENTLCKASDVLVRGQGEGGQDEWGCQVRLE